jgi:hypothetical protein
MEKVVADHSFPLVRGTLQPNVIDRAVLKADAYKMEYITEMNPESYQLSGFTSCFWGLFST